MDREVAKARRRVNNQLMYCYFKMHLLQFMLFNEYMNIYDVFFAVTWKPFENIRFITDLPDHTV